MFRVILLFTLFCTALLGCDAGHLGNPLMLPVSGIKSGLENAAYNARRRPVKAYISANQSAIVRDLRGQNGPHLAKVCELARVAPSNCAKLPQTLRPQLPLYEQDAEALTIAFMVHGA